jgi:hypothetical protein
VLIQIVALDVELRDAVASEERHTVAITADERCRGPEPEILRRELGSIGGGVRRRDGITPRR